jgi:hypothetical protein
MHCARVFQSRERGRGIPSGPANINRMPSQCPAEPSPHCIPHSPLILRTAAERAVARGDLSSIAQHILAWTEHSEVKAVPAIVHSRINLPGPISFLIPLFHSKIHNPQSSILNLFLRALRASAFQSSSSSSSQ